MASDGLGRPLAALILSDVPPKQEEDQWEEKEEEEEEKEEGGEPIWLVSISPVTCCSPPQSAQVPGQVLPNTANIVAARILKIQDIPISRGPVDPQLNLAASPLTTS